MKSMTGFGQGLAVGDGITVQVEVSTVNRKNLDVHFSFPRSMNALESRCQKLVAETCARGRIQIRVQVEKSGGDENPVSLDEVRAKAWLDQLNRFAAAEGLEPVRKVSDVLRFPRVIKEEETAGDHEAELWPLLEKALQSALKELSGMRESEGAHLTKVLSQLLEELEGLLEQLKPMLPAAREELALKIRNAVEGLGELSPEMQSRVIQEIALQAERSDVQEEVDRVQGHLEQMREKCLQSEPVGRALDFICQELAREFNTLSVKASRAELNRLALAGKETVEKIREQVQNIE